MKVLLTAALIAATTLSVPAQAGPQCESIASAAGNFARDRANGIPRSKVKNLISTIVAHTATTTSERQTGAFLLSIVDSIYNQNPALTEKEATMIYYLACEREIGDQ